MKSRMIDNMAPLLQRVVFCSGKLEVKLTTGRQHTQATTPISTPTIEQLPNCCILELDCNQPCYLCSKRPAMRRNEVFRYSIGGRWEIRWIPYAYTGEMEEYNVRKNELQMRRVEIIKRVLLKWHSRLLGGQEQEPGLGRAVLWDVMYAFASLP